MACCQVTAALQILAQKAFEWPEKHAMVAFVGDVWRAFDFLRPDVVCQAMVRRKIPSILIAASLRENLHNVLEPIFPGTSEDVEIEFSKCERTGSTDAPRKWNMVLEDALLEVSDEWAERRQGIIDGVRWSHLLWCDNIFFY